MFSRQRIPVHETLTGEELCLNVFKIPGLDPEAPSMYLQASLHGAEIQGNLVVEELLTHFIKNPPRGNITLVPFANPIGANNKQGDFTAGRYEPVSGHNWNRCFVDLSDVAKECSPESPLLELRSQLQSALEKQKNFSSAAHRLAWNLQKLALDHDVVIDLHCDTESVPYVYCPEYALKDLGYLGFDFAIAVPHRFSGSMDEAFFVPWAILQERGAVAKFWPRAFTFELGPQEKVSRLLARDQALTILAYFNYCWTGQAPGLRKNPWVCRLENTIDIPAPGPGIAEMQIALGEMCKRGDTLATITNLAALTNTDLNSVRSQVLAPDDGFPVMHFSSASLVSYGECIKFFCRPYRSPH